MTTYVYETVPQKPGDSTKLFEIKQSMNDAPLTKHPETGEPIQRVILGGYGLMSRDEAASPESCGDNSGGCCCC